MSYVIVKMPRSCCIENCSNNAKSQTNLVFYIPSSDKQRRQRWLPPICRAQHHLTTTFYTPRSLINYMQRKYIFAVLLQNPIKHASNIHPNVFNSFYQTIAHGENKRTFTWPPVPQHFSSQNPPISLQKIHQISTGPEKPPHHTLFFSLKQNSLFRDRQSHFSPHWNHCKCTCSFNEHWCPSLSNRNGVQKTKSKSSTRQTGQTRVTNSQVAATHEFWLVKYSSLDPGFSRTNLGVCQNLIFLSAPYS